MKNTSKNSLIKGIPLLLFDSLEVKNKFIAAADLKMSNPAYRQELVNSLQLLISRLLNIASEEYILSELRDHIGSIFRSELDIFKKYIEDEDEIERQEVSNDR